jgi:hypothetical protein
VPSVVTAPASTVPVVTEAGMFDATKRAACETDRRTLEIAVEAYWAMTGVAPASEAELVSQQILRTEIQGFDLDAAGNIVAAPAAICA